MVSLAAFALLAPALLAVQGPRDISLDKPEAVLRAEFTQIRGVRELRDGRVIVSDRLDQGVVVVDFSTHSVRTIGRVGPGPQEYRLPTSLYPLPGDSTLLIDEGNSRVAIIGPDARIHRSFAMMVPGFGVPLGARGVDAQGRYFVQIPGWLNPPGTPRDSVVIVRFDARANRVDTVARIKGSTPRPSTQTLGLPYIMFAPQDVWGVSPDGRVAIARSSDYHVDWIAPGAAPVRGSVVSFERFPVTFADRLAHVRVFAQNSSTQGRAADGVSIPQPPGATDDSTNRGIAERNPFAETHPPFTSALPYVGPDGSFWVERSVRLGQPAMWDVFDRRGVLTDRVRLPAERRLAGVGARSLYLIATDRDGLQKLERYRRPST